MSPVTKPQYAELKPQERRRDHFMSLQPILNPPLRCFMQLDPPPDIFGRAVSPPDIFGGAVSPPDIFVELSPPQALSVGTKDSTDSLVELDAPLDLLWS